MNGEKNIIEIKDLVLGYPSGLNSFKAIMPAINLRANNGQLIAVIGRNGSGKSTLLKTISRISRQVSGNVFIEGVNANDISRNEFARKVAFVSTELQGISNIKVNEIVSLGRFPYTGWLGKCEEADRNIVNETMKLLELQPFSDKYFYNLSDGEKQKVMIARALAQDTGILVLDEPTAFLDLPNKYEVIGILDFLASKKNKTIIFSTHDLNIAIEKANRIWLMEKESIVEDSPDNIVLNGSFSHFFKAPESLKNRLN